MNEFEELFKRFGDWRVMLGFYEMRESISVEELYLAFKSKMHADEQIDELAKALMPRIIDTIFLQLDALLECYPQAEAAIRKRVFPKGD